MGGGHHCKQQPGIEHGHSWPCSRIQIPAFTRICLYKSCIYASPSAVPSPFSFPPHPTLPHLPIFSLVRTAFGHPPNHFWAMSHGAHHMSAGKTTQACISSAEDISRAEGVSELLSWHRADATHPGVLDELGLAATTVVFLYAYPTLLARLKVHGRHCRIGFMTPAPCLVLFRPGASSFTSLAPALVFFIECLLRCLCPVFLQHISCDTCACMHLSRRGRTQRIFCTQSWFTICRASNLSWIMYRCFRFVFLFFPTVRNQGLLARLRRKGARIFTLQYHIEDGEGWEAVASCDTEPSTRLYPALASDPLDMQN